MNVFEKITDIKEAKFSSHDQSKAGNHYFKM